MSNWSSFFSFLSPRAKRPARRPSFRLELNSLEARITPSQIAPHTGPSNAAVHQNPGHHNGQVGSISGSVVDSEFGTPMAGVTVTLTDDLNGGAVVATTQTLADGSYSFTGLQAGTYTVTATPAIGYMDTLSLTTGSLPGGTVGTGTISGIQLMARDVGTGYTLGEAQIGIPA